MPGSFEYSARAGEVLPAGTHSLSVTFTPNDGLNYAAAQAMVPLSVSQATPAIDWPAPEPIVDETPLGPAQLCATAPVPGTFVYVPPAGDTPSPGMHSLSVTFIPADRANYTQTQAGVPLTVLAKSKPVIAWPEPEAITYGVPLSAALLCATASVPGRFDYSPAPGTVLAAGTHKLSVTFTAHDSASYATAQAAVSLIVAKATPLIDWPRPKAVPFGTRLSARQLNASASVPGTFEYSPAPEEQLAAGTHTLAVTFAPRDSANYTTAQATVSLYVARARPIIEWPEPKPARFGTPLGGKQLCATAQIPGTFEYSPAAGETPAVGTHTLSVTFTPEDNENYATTQATVSLKVVAKAIPVIAWPNPEPIPYGTPLDSTQLCATALVPGTLTYSVDPGEILEPGTHTLSVSFVPSDSETYVAAQAMVVLQVEELPDPALMPVPSTLSGPPRPLRESDASQWLDPYAAQYGEHAAHYGEHVTQYGEPMAPHAPFPSDPEIEEEPKTAKKNWIVTAVGVCSILVLLIFVGAIFRFGMKFIARQSAPPAPAATETQPKPSPPKPWRRTRPAPDRPTRLQTEMMDDQLTAPARIPHAVQKQTPAGPPPSATIATLGLGGSGAIGAVFKGHAPRVVTVAPPAPSGPLAIPPSVALALLTEKRLPVYPPIAKEARVSGTVDLQATISKAGDIEDLEFVSGPVMLRQAAIDAVRTWRFRPYKLNSQPIEVQTTISIVFSLGG